MSTKVLINSAQLHEILLRHPEVELDLLKNAVPQLATMLAAKAKTTTEQIDVLVSQAFEAARKDPSSRWGANPIIRSAVRLFLNEECKEDAKTMMVTEIRKEIETMARKEVNAALVTFGADLQKAVTSAKEEVNAYIRAEVEKEIIALLRAGKLQVAA